MDTRRQFITLAALLLLVQFVFAGVESYELGRIHAEVQQNVEVAKKAVGALDHVRVADARFKNQVQEWKNILLRGDQADDLKKYVAQFEAEAKSVQNALGELDALAPSLAHVEKAAVDRLMKSHADMLASYRKALAAGSTKLVSEARAVDAAVRGIDREFTESLRDMASALNEHTSVLTRKVSDDAVARLERQQDISMIKLAIACAVIILLVVAFLAFRRQA